MDFRYEPYNDYGKRERYAPPVMMPPPDYSRIVDYDNWMINPLVFQWLDTLWGPHMVDRFSSPENSQLDRFNSRFWTPGSEAVDAFTCDWAEDNNWSVPPVHLIPRVIRHAQGTKAQGTLIAPEWPSSLFWLLLSRPS